MFSKTNIKHRILIIILLLLFNFQFCSKTGNNKILNKFNGNPVIPYEANTIFIDKIINLTERSELTFLLRRKIIDNINKNGRLVVAKKKNNSDLYCSCILTKFKIIPLETAGDGTILKKRLAIDMQVTLINNKTHEYIFKNILVAAFTDYSDISPPVTPFSIIVDKLLNELSSRIALQIETGWYTKLKKNIEKGKK